MTVCVFECQLECMCVCTGVCVCAIMIVPVSFRCLYACVHVHTIQHQHTVLPPSAIGRCFGLGRSRVAIRSAGCADGSETFHLKLSQHT